MGTKWVFLLLILTSCGATGNIVIDDHEMGEASSEVSELLYVDPEKVVEKQSEFVAKLRTVGKDKRSLFEEYVDVIGANGILDGIEKLWPKCHSEAHDIGKVIYAELKDIGQGLSVCADRCYSGCMHGVLMDAFSAYHDTDDAEGHVDVEKLKPAMNDLCFKNEQMSSSYSPGDCAHGLGHALMFLSGYDIREAIDGCNMFEEPHMIYYCATGAYMEYVTENDKEDAETKSLMYPCDAFDYPSACSRYKLVHVLNRHYKAKGQLSEIIEECEKLNGKFRLGCFHGLGNGHMPVIASGRMKISDVCLTGSEDEKFVCIEGSIERMAKYHKEFALKACETLEGKYKDICLKAVDQGMYNMDKDLSVYMAE
jgi:hypothetical protein